MYTPVDLNNNTEMHYTYASPGTGEYYRKTGKFADGTVLVKEVFATDHAQFTTGDAHWATSTKVWFRHDQRRQGTLSAAIRSHGAMDGDGPFSNPMRPINRLLLTTKKTAWAAHVPAKATDWVYVQRLRVLKSKVSRTLYRDTCF